MPVIVIQKRRRQIDRVGRPFFPKLGNADADKLVQFFFFLRFKFLFFLRVVFPFYKFIALQIIKIRFSSCLCVFVLKILNSDFELRFCL